MLTPADQPLDKLRDLSADEMYDYAYLSLLIKLMFQLSISHNMNGQLSA